MLRLLGPSSQTRATFAVTLVRSMPVPTLKMYIDLDTVHVACRSSDSSAHDIHCARVYTILRRLSQRSNSACYPIHLKSRGSPDKLQDELHADPWPPYVLLPSPFLSVSESPKPPNVR